MVTTSSRISPLLRSLATSSLLVAGALASASAQAAITFDFTYSASATDAFNDATYGSARRTALETAGTLYSNMFASHFSDTGTVTIAVTGTNNSSGALASAGSYYYSDGSTGFKLEDAVRNQLQGTGSYSAPQGLLTYHFGYNWELDPNATPSNSEFDFYAVAFHELTHAVGFTSTLKSNGLGLFNDNRWGTFAQFVTDQAGTKVIDPNTFTLNTAVWNAASVGGTGTGLFFDGANAVAANGGNLVPLHSPTTWESGSSSSHVDELAPFNGMMMSYSTGTGLGVRDFSEVEVGMLQDLGYTAAVPEPETYAMLMAGLGVVGFMRRRRKD